MLTLARLHSLLEDFGFSVVGASRALDSTQNAALAAPAAEADPDVGMWFVDVDAAVYRFRDGNSVRACAVETSHFVRTLRGHRARRVHVVSEPGLYALVVPSWHDRSPRIIFTSTPRATATFEVLR